jgi:hypothetical protein
LLASIVLVMTSGTKLRAGTSMASVVLIFEILQFRTSVL